MKRTEYLYRLNSENWGDYQVAIRDLREEVSSDLYRIGLAYWNMIQELEGTNLKTDKWEMSKPTPKWTKELGFHLVLRLSKVISWSVKSYYREEYPVGLGSRGSDIPDSAKDFEFDIREVIIPNKFVEEFK